MTSPRVIELPRRLEPVGRDTFLSAAGRGARRRVPPPAGVVALRPRDARALHRASAQPQRPAAA